MSVSNSIHTARLLLTHHESTSLQIARIPSLTNRLHLGSQGRSEPLVLLLLLIRRSSIAGSQLTQSKLRLTKGVRRLLLLLLVVIRRAVSAKGEARRGLLLSSGSIRRRGGSSSKAKATSRLSRLR